LNAEETKFYIIFSFMAIIHPSSIVDSKAELDSSVEVGPFCIIGPRVKIGRGTKFMSHVRVEGPTAIGKDNIFFPFSFIGAIPQDLKYKGEESELIIGDRNRVRECVTLNRGTTGGGNVTKIGNDNLLMAYVHLGHDTIVGNGTVIANAVNVAGHVNIHDGARVGGITAVTQFIAIGTMAFTGACCLIQKDIPPFVSVTGNPAEPRGINKVGLERKGVPAETIEELISAYKILYMKKLTTTEAIKKIESSCNTSLKEIQVFLDFIKNSKNGIAR
jgi:UDP-N-acetylglucosamine acyltransferase